MTGSKGIAGPILLILVGIGVGVASAMYGPVALLGGVALVGGWLMLTKPYMGILLIAATLPLENAAVFGEGVTATRLIGVTVAGGWLIGKVLRGESFSKVLRSPVTWFALSFTFFVLASALWAEDTRVVRAGFIQLVQLVVLCAIAMDVIEDWDQIQGLCRVLVGAGVVGAALTLWESSQGGMSRAGETVAGINGTAELLVTVMPLAFYLIVSERQLVWRLVGAAYIGVGSGAVLATLSRFSIMLLPVVAGVMAFQTLRAGRGRGWLLAGFAAVTFAVFSQEASFERLERRIQSILPYLTTTVSADEEGLSARGFHLAVGVQMYQDNALLGVGYNNFGYHFLYRYQYEVVGGNNHWQSRRNPHSSHIGIMAELGTVGTLIWFGLLAAALSAIWKAGRIPVVYNDRVLTTLSFAVLFSVVLQAGPYGFYAPSQKSKLFWLLVALGVALWRIARETQEDMEWTETETEWVEDGHEPEFAYEGYGDSGLVSASTGVDDPWNRSLPGIRVQSADTE